MSKLQERKIRHASYRLYATLASSFGLFFLAFLAAFWASSVLAPVNTSDAESVTVSVNRTGYYVTVTANDIDLTLDTTPDGALAVAKDTVNTKTNCNGYQLYLSSATTSPTTSIMDPSTHEVANVATNSLILEGSDTTSGDWLPATAGSFLSADGGPQAFKDSSNTNLDTWGFAVPSGSASLPTGVGSFDATYGTTADDNVNVANKFAAVPLYTNPQLIQETSTPNAGAGVNLDVYYGVYASMNKTAGNYSADVLYTVLGKDASVSAAVSPSTITKLDGTSSINIITPIFTSMPLTSSDITATVGGTSCPVTGISTLDENEDPDVLKVTCTAPNKNVGSYDVVINITKFGQDFTITNGVTYSLGGTTIASVSPNSMVAGKSSDLASNIAITTNTTATGLTASDLTVQIGNTTIPTSGLSLSGLGTGMVVTINKSDSATATALNGISAGTYNVTITAKGQTLSATNAFTIALPAFWTITTMQEMTPDVCNSVYTPAAYTSYTGTAPVIINKASAEAGNYTATGNGTAQVPETTLIDYRGTTGTGTASNPITTGGNVKTYTVRKLADGNCWMTEHLALPLTQGTGIEASFGTTTAGSISTFTYTPTSNATIGTNTQNNATYGWHYNWLAATAERGTTSTAANVDVNGSICPKGWRLPANYTISTTLSWGALTTAYGITANGAGITTSTGYLYLEASPLSLQRSGIYSGGSFYSGGSGGYYWSSTAQSTSLAYLLYYDSVNVYPQGSYSKSSLGFSVRCLAVR